MTNVAKPTHEKQPRGGQSRSGGFASKLIALLIPLVLLALLEGALRLAGYGDELNLAYQVEENGQKWWQINSQVSRRYFGAHPEFARSAEEMRIPVNKPENGLRIICLGGSSMAGFPYNYNATMPGILYTYLRQLFPNRHIEVVNLGIAAVNSFAVRDLMPDVLELQPDAVLIYTGHNEFYGALGVGSGFSLGNQRGLINLALRLQRFRSYYLIQRGIFTVLRWIRGEADISDTDATPVMQRMAARQKIPLNSELVRQAGENLRRNLADAIADARSAGVPVFLGTLVSNVKDHPPFIAESSQQLSADQQRAWQEALLAGKNALTTGETGQAQRFLQAALQIDSTRADVHFALGKLLLTSDSLAARRALEKARDHDLLRFRAPGHFNKILHDLAGQTGCSLVKIDSVFTTRSPEGIPGKELISEHLHPRPAGYTLMAKSFLSALNKARVLPAVMPPRRIAALPEKPAKLRITPLDLMVGKLRIKQLTSGWPFHAPVELPVPVDPELQQALRPISLRYIGHDLLWGEAHLEYARLLIRKGRPGLAAAEYRAVLNYYPDIFLGENEFKLWEQLVEVEMNGGLYSEAEIDAARLMGRFPDNPWGAVQLGKVLLAQSRFKEAERAFQQAMKINKNHPRFEEPQRSYVLYLWGAAMANQRKLLPARRKLAQALKLDPHNQAAEQMLIQINADIERGP